MRIKRQFIAPAVSLFLVAVLLIAWARTFYVTDQLYRLAEVEAGTFQQHYGIAIADSALGFIYRPPAIGHRPVKPVSQYWGCGHTPPQTGVIPTDHPTIWGHLRFYYATFPDRDSTHYILAIPLWLLALLSAIPFAWFMFLSPRRRRRYRMAHNLCPACGYDLQASKEYCPECGSRIVASGDCCG